MTDIVREKLNKIIDQYSQLPGFVNFFQGNTQVSNILSELTADTSKEQLKTLGHLSAEEKRRLGELNILIASAELDKFHTQIEALTQKLYALKSFRDQLFEAQNQVDDNAIEDLRAQILSHQKRLELALNVSVTNFKSDQISSVGTESWHRFVAAAQMIATSEGTLEKPYPQPESHCLLCQQPLTPKAQELLHSLWAFLESDAQDLVNESQEILEEKIKTLSSLALFDLSKDLSTPYKYIRDEDSELEKGIVTFVESLHERRESLINALMNKSLPEVVDLPVSHNITLEKIIAETEIELGRLSSVDLDAEMERLNVESFELEHREKLAQILPEVLNYIDRLIWVENAKKVGGNTARITKFHNQLFSLLVTDQYVQLFEENLRKLGRPLRVQVQTRGRKGETLKQIILLADETAKHLAKPDKVLSEGEKRAVALADFLTEVVLDEESSGIILDDPVTSLDLNWREAIARVLVEHARHHQVIVFTHDLSFLYYLKDFADSTNLQDVQAHWVKRGEFDDLPGYTYINNSPALERTYRKATVAKEWLVKSKAASPADQEKYLKEGFGALRTSYEAFIVFEMLNEVVQRFNERISFGRLEGVVWDETIAQEVVKKCELLSRHIEGHLHSNEFIAVKPTPEILENEIADFEALTKRLKGLKKEKAS